MKIIYQGKETETASTSVGAVLAASGVAVDMVVVEYKGDILPAGAVATTPLEEGASLNVFKIVTGG